MSLALHSSDNWVQPTVLEPLQGTALVHSLFPDMRRLIISRELQMFCCRLSDTFRAQAMLYFPVLLIARVSWVVQSVFFVFGDLPGAKIWSTKGAEQDPANRKDTLASTLEVCGIQTPSVVTPISRTKTCL